MTAPLLSSGSFYSRICHEQEEATGGRTRDQHDECRRRTRKKSAPLALTDGRYSGCCIAMSVVGWNQAQLLKQRQRATKTQSSIFSRRRFDESPSVEILTFFPVGHPP